MKQTLQIDASFDKPELLENMIIQLTHATKAARTFYTCNTWEEVHTSSIETFASGSIKFFEEGTGETMKIPFVTHFVFTCIHPGNALYAVPWSMSMN